jgi:hypothetical protein
MDRCAIECKGFVEIEAYFGIDYGGRSGATCICLPVAVETPGGFTEAGVEGRIAGRQRTSETGNVSPESDPVWRMRDQITCNPHQATRQAPQQLHLPQRKAPPRKHFTHRRQFEAVKRESLSSSLAPRERHYKKWKSRCVNRESANH